MTAAIPVTRPSGSGQPATAGRKLSIADITGKGNKLPSRYIIHATEGWGKTTFGTHFPAPVFLQIGSETGLETLIDAGRVPEIPHFPAITSWEEIFSVLETLRADTHKFRTVVVDTVNGAESLCHQFICARDFDNQWGNKGFGSYNKGFEVSLPEWSMFLSALDKLRTERKMTVVLLCHTKVKAFKNPEGPDYDRYQPDVHEKTWGLTHKWADAVLFGSFEVTVQTEKAGDKRGKGIGAPNRALYTERHAAYDAKNRLGLPAEIDMGSAPSEAWAAFSAAIRQGRSTAVPQQTDSSQGGE